MKQPNLSVFFITVFALAIMVFAQEKKAEKPKYGWRKEAVGILNFTQNQFDNWKQGGDNSWSWQMNFNGNFNLVQEQYSWTNSVKLSYGQTKLGNAEARKAADEIRLETVYTRKMNIYINPYVSASALTQFTNGYDYAKTPKEKISALLDPGYFTQSAGLGFQPLKQVKTRLGAALKETMAKDFRNRYADGKEMRTEYGAESVTDVNWQMAANILFTSKLEMFSNLKAINEVDVNWDNMFTSKITKYIGVSFNIKLLYDRDISSQRQLKQTLAVGLNYSFL